LVLAGQAPRHDPRRRASASKSKHAQPMSREAALVKLADNLRNAAANSARDCSIERRTEYVEWTKAVMLNCRGGPRAHWVVQNGRVTDVDRAWIREQCPARAPARARGRA
jgi:hypothetical protein